MRPKLDAFGLDPGCNETPSKECYPVIVEMEVSIDGNISPFDGDGSGSKCCDAALVAEYGELGS
jgi:hypothetical protein